MDHNTNDSAHGSDSAEDTGSTMGTRALAAAVQNSDEQGHDVTQGIHGQGHKHPWLEKLIPGAEKLTVKLHAGNFVAVRDRTKPPGSEKIFESMPIYARIGMHILFHGREQVKLLEGHKIEAQLKAQSVKEGRIYDNPESKKSIPSFIHIYGLDVSELLEPDPTKYNTFNEFFYRKLKPDARPLENDSTEALCSAADCRITVYDTVAEAQKFWIKGDEFTLERLLYGSAQPDSEALHSFEGTGLAIFRLAPADYHRFHSPLDATVVGEPTNIDGTYYTVNPQAVNEVDFDVFTANKRSVLYLRDNVSQAVVAFVAIGALLVGSIAWTKKAGDSVKKGEELGYFAYGGSTIVVVFPKGLIRFDDDLVTNSQNVLETLVKMGSSLGVRC